MLDFNRVNLSESPISVAINALIEHAEPPEKNAREYLGASAIGHECNRGRLATEFSGDVSHRLN